MAQIPFFDYDAVLSAVSPEAAIGAVHRGFGLFARGEWTMPPKVYLDSPPHGDFRAMPARGGGLAVLKWVTSFPDNLARGLPTVTGVVIVSDADNGEPLALVNGRAVTALRTGAAAVVAAKELANPGARSVGLIGCGVHGTWVARCMNAAGYEPGKCFDRDRRAAEQLSAELGWEIANRKTTVACDIVNTVTPGHETVIEAGSLRPGQHLNMIGADAPGKAEASHDALKRSELYCDDWEQASHGGELGGAVRAGLIKRGDVVELGALIAGSKRGRSSSEAITLFDSTGLAIQDLAICTVLLERWRARQVEAATIEL